MGENALLSISLSFFKIAIVAKMISAPEIKKNMTCDGESTVVETLTSESAIEYAAMEPTMRKMPRIFVCVFINATVQKPFCAGSFYLFGFNTIRCFMVFLLPRLRAVNSALKESVGYFACLLYTSPSPRDKRQSRMPSSA